MWTTRVFNPVCSPHFRASASVTVQLVAFATGVPPNLYAFHRYTGIPLTSPLHSSPTVSKSNSHLKQDFSSRLTEPPTRPLRPIIPQRFCPLHITAAAGVVSRGFLLGYRLLLVSKRTGGSRSGSSFFLHAALLGQGEFPPIAQYSPTAASVGVWAVSQSQCGRCPLVGYRSSAVGRYLTNYLIGREPPQTDKSLPQFHVKPWSYAVLVHLSVCYSPCLERLLTRYSPVAAKTARPQATHSPSTCMC